MEAIRANAGQHITPMHQPFFTKKKIFMAFHGMDG
jgi:hypothetical protein